MTGNNATMSRDIPATAMVRVSDLHISFGKKQVLNGVDLSLAEGENLVIVGRSGCGKSVLLKCIIGLIKPDSGSIQVFDQEIMNISRHDLNELRSKIGFLFQGNALYDSMNVEENLLFTLLRRHRGKSRKEASVLVDEVLEDVGLPEARLLMPGELSGGMKKRIGLARALILKPGLMLYDEPTTGLDPITSKEISELMLDMQHRYNMTSLIISHDPQCVRITSNRILVLGEGRIYAAGTHRELSMHHDPAVNSFFKQI